MFLPVIALPQIIPFVGVMIHNTRSIILIIITNNVNGGVTIFHDAADIAASPLMQTRALLCG